MNPKIIYFEDFLCKIKNPLAENYRLLPEDLQEIIYNNIRNGIQIEKTKYMKHIFHQFLRAKIRPIEIDYNIYAKGAWEYLYHKKNWSLSIEDAYNYYHNDTQIGQNILNNIRININ